jgi:hypothetical protein
MTAMLLSPVTASALAHVGSPDIYAESNAGPYRLFVTIRPPLVIPGIAKIEVQGPSAWAAGSPRISEIEIAPIPLTGEASLHPPVADKMKHPAEDGQFFTGALWIMGSGSWQVRFTVHGSAGDAVLSIPVPATASSTLGMTTGLGIFLGALGLLLVAGVIGIVGAAARDAQLPPGAPVSVSGRKRAVIAMAIALVLMILAVWRCAVWWNSEAADYGHYVYKPLTMQATLTSHDTIAGQKLDLLISDPGWLRSRKTDDFVLDHDHLMHLYLIREPGIDVVYHLHPEQIAPAEFQLTLPSMPAGSYNLYADVVHATGFPETLVAKLDLPEIAGRPLAGDDARGFALPVVPAAGAAACPANPPLGSRFPLLDGYTMVWDNPQTVPAKTPQIFRFSLLDAHGNPAPDRALYMGMPGHAAFVKDDGSVFAHVHPSGTVSMAALMMAAAQNQGSASGAMAAMPGMDHASTPVAPTPDIGTVREGKSGANTLPEAVGFPYGFPTPGAYRILVQMKHGDTVETGAFDACAGPVPGH